MGTFMSRRYPQIMYTDSFKETQDHYGTRIQNLKMERKDWPDAQLTERESDFISQRDSFYMATLSDTGWPYLQLRGEPSGFLKVLDEITLAFTDFRSNLQ